MLQLCRKPEKKNGVLAEDASEAKGRVAVETEERWAGGFSWPSPAVPLNIRTTGTRTRAGSRDPTPSCDAIAMHGKEHMLFVHSCATMTMSEQIEESAGSFPNPPPPQLGLFVNNCRE